MTTQTNPFVTGIKKPTSVEKAARTKASVAENTKSNPYIGFRADDEIRAKFEDLRLALHKETGRVPNASETLRVAIEEALSRRSKK